MSRPMPRHGTKMMLQLAVQDDPDRQERLYLQLATSYIICSKLDSGLASATPRTVIFDSNELEYGQYRGR